MINPQLIQALRNRQQPGMMPPGAGMAGGGGSVPIGAAPMSVTPAQPPAPTNMQGAGGGAGDGLMSKLGQVLAKRASAGSGSPDFSQFAGLGGQVGPMGSSGLQQQKPGASIGGTAGGVAGTALGTAVGGPVGGAIGGFLGNAAGSAMGGSGVWDKLSGGLKSLFSL